MQERIIIDKEDISYLQDMFKEDEYSIPVIIKRLEPFSGAYKIIRKQENLTKHNSRNNQSADEEHYTHSDGILDKGKAD